MQHIEIIFHQLPLVMEETQAITPLKGRASSDNG